MKWFSTVSKHSKFQDATQEIIENVRSNFNEQVDLGVLFISEEFMEFYGDVANELRQKLNIVHVIGCSSGGVIGNGIEIERKPALSLTVASLPDVQINPFHLEQQDLPHSPTAHPDWRLELNIPEKPIPNFILLADPFSFSTDIFLDGLDKSYPNSPKIGGLASGAREPGLNALYLNDNIYQAGLVGIALTGQIKMNTIVAQGCRPIGNPHFITRCQGNMLFELDGKPAAKVIDELYISLNESDKKLFQTSLFLGIVMREHQDKYEQGDFLIRNIMALDPETQALAVVTLLKDNMVVQFHLRDAQTSTQDLQTLLGQYKKDQASTTKGALLFSCLGRGEYLFGEPNHDSNMFKQFLGDVSLGGFFCNGEIGPVHGSTFIHGYTSSFGLFCEQ